MNADRKKKLTQSVLVALAFAVIFPALWVAVLGESTSSTPVVEKQFMDSMSEKEHREWISANTKSNGFVEHIKSLPQFFVAHWRGYLEASAGVFIVAFVLNSAFLLGGTRNEP